MRYKVSLIAFVSLLLIAFPQNSFTCGATEDPYDYYTSFFSNNAGTGKAYKPFYYTALLTFYDDWAEDSTSFENDRIVQEWKQYLKAPEKAVVQLVYQSGSNDVEQLKQAVATGKPLFKPLLANAAAQNLLKEKDLQAATYLAFAKKVEKISTANEWDNTKKDSLAVNEYINEANHSFVEATNSFIKNKWAFQRCKLAFYNNRFTDCIRWYNEFFNDEDKAAVMQLALSYKAGSEFRSGKAKEAAYSFSKAFPLSAQNKKQNFLGFLWATENCNPALTESYAAQCKNNPEKANMLALFGLYGTSYKLETLQKVYALNPSSALLPLLATREINKLEEQYLTPVLSKEKGGKALYYSWDAEDETSGKPKINQPDQVIKTANQLEKMMADKSLTHRSLYGAGAAYLHFMIKDYAKAASLSTEAKTLATETKVKDQLALIDLLIVANETKTITPEKEAQMLPAFQWLVEKAKHDKEYALFCRNFFSEILAQKYEQQADASKAALAYGVADLTFIKRSENDYYYYSPPAIDFIRNSMNTADLLKLYDLTNTPPTETIKYFLRNASFKKDHVVDIIGTSFLRDRNYPKAIEWLSKAGKLEPLMESQYNYKTDKEITVNVDPLYDYINDWQRLNKAAIKPYTKLTLAQKLLELQTKAESKSTDDKSRVYYQLATALYNMSYYGNSWKAVAYYRPSSAWNEGVYKQPWEKEYFGVYKAKEYYQKAYDAATDKEFKASCLFMVIKCAQRQIPKPAYDYNNSEATEKNEADFERKFKNNPLFEKFKTEFGNTKFYPYVYNRCSYLRDYVKSNNTRPTAPIKKKQ